jgi:hypothetical protein
MIDLTKKIIDFFDKLEDKVRGHLSRYPILYTFIGGTALVLFWRGVWHTADILQQKGGWLEWIFYEPNNLVIVTIILLMTGLFASYFIGDTILMTGLKKQKKTTDKTAKEIEEEEKEISSIDETIKDIKKEVDSIEQMEKKISDINEIKKEITELRDLIEKEHNEHQADHKK